MDVTIYGTSRCSACKTTKEQLDRLGIKATYVIDDIEAMNKLDIRKVPTIIFDNGLYEVQRFVGPQPDSVYFELLRT